MLGVLEVATALALFAGFAVRYVGLFMLVLWAGTLAIFLIIAVAAPAETGFPFLNMAGQFLLKDLVLFAAAIMVIAVDSENARGRDASASG